MEIKIEVKKIIDGKMYCETFIDTEFELSAEHPQEHWFSMYERIIERIESARQVSELLSKSGQLFTTAG